MASLPNIKYIGDFNKAIVAKDDPNTIISFNEPKDFFEMSENYNAFVKDCESMCRSHEDYKHYVDYVERTIGLDFCQVNPNIHKEDATIEMHHGPLFTLFDYASVILNSFIDLGKSINTFDVVDQLLEEHYALRVQTVMLAKTNHESVHNRDIFLNIKQGFGHLDQFIEKYADHLTLEQKYRIAKYIEICECTDSFDNYIFDNAKVKKIVSAF